MTRLNECDRTGQRWQLAERFFDRLPHGRLIGLTPVAVEPDAVTARLPYQPELVGNPDTGVLHGGAITTLVDQTSGVAVLVALNQGEAIATLDLRLDYLRAAQPERDVYARACCYRLTPHIAFTQCSVYQEDSDRPVAMSMATFMRASDSGPSLVEGAP